MCYLQGQISTRDEARAVQLYSAYIKVYNQALIRKPERKRAEIKAVQQGMNM